MSNEPLSLAEEYTVPPEEEERILRSAFNSRAPLRLRQLPARLKRKYIVLKEIATIFTPSREYTEQEINRLLGEVHEDFAALRRYLIDLGFLSRLSDGSRYWLTDPGSTTLARKGE